MTKQLNIRNDEVYARAHRIAERLGQPVSEAILTVLREYEAHLPKVDELTPSQRATYDRLRQLSKETARHKIPGATSAHEELYDDFGLPK
jgi:antitoxin VapB